MWSIWVQWFPLAPLGPYLDVVGKDLGTPLLMALHCCGPTATYCCWVCVSRRRTTLLPTEPHAESHAILDGPRVSARLMSLAYLTGIISRAYLTGILWDYADHVLSHTGPFYIIISVCPVLPQYCSPLSCMLGHMPHWNGPRVSARLMS